MAVVRSLLEYWGLRVLSERTLARLFGSDLKCGTDPEVMAEYLRLMGLRTKVREGGKLRDIRAAVERKEPPILLWADWGGHYCLVVGYEAPVGIYRDYSEGLFILGDPAGKHDGRPNGIRWVSGARLKAMWFDSVGDLTNGLWISVRP